MYFVVASVTRVSSRSKGFALEARLSSISGTARTVVLPSVANAGAWPWMRASALGFCREHLLVVLDQSSPPHVAALHGLQLGAVPAGCIRRSISHHAPSRAGRGSDPTAYDPTGVRGAGPGGRRGRAGAGNDNGHNTLRLSTA